MSEQIIVYNWTVIHPNTTVEQGSRLYGSSAEAWNTASKSRIDERDKIIIFENLIEIDPILAYRMMHGFAENGYGYQSIQKLLWSRQLVLCTPERT